MRHLRLFGLFCALVVSTSAPHAQSPRLTADTSQSTTEGATFIAPLGWSVTVRGPATVLEPPEADSRISLVDVRAADAVKAAWTAYRPDAKWPLKVATPLADQDGWKDRRRYIYETSPNERRDVAAVAMRSGNVWTVAISDISQPTGEKRMAQVALIFGRLFPKGYRRETLAGRPAHSLDATRVADLGAFVERACDQLGAPGVAIGLIQNGKVVFAGGFGVRELREPDTGNDGLLGTRTAKATSVVHLYNAS
jgi:hypothetical protein